MELYPDILLDCPFLSDYIPKTIYLLLESNVMNPKDFIMGKTITKYCEDMGGEIDMADEYF